MATPPAPPKVDGRRKAAAARRRAREAELIAATRQLFDSKGVRDVQIEEIAGAVGINRAIVYRHFTGKEELFALTLVGYLEELERAMAEGADSGEGTVGRLEGLVGGFVDYGLAHPAFVDCAQALMFRPGDELLEEISEGALFRLGRAISSCLSILTAALTDGVETGQFALRDDPALVANMLYASGLGALQLGRLGILVSEAAPGIPTVGAIAPEQVKTYIVTSTLAMVGQRDAVTTG